MDPSEVPADLINFYAREWTLVYHRRYETAERLFDSFDFFASQDQTYLMVMASPFFAGLIAAGRYRETGHRRHLATLRKSIKTLRNIGKTRGRNWIHTAFLLEAEELSITVKDKRHSRIQHAYNLAIITATQSMCIHDVALAYELAGEHYISHDGPDLVGDYFDNAVEHYAAWGCKTKVDDIKERRGQFVTTRYHRSKANPKLTEWTRHSHKIEELFGIVSRANLAGFEVVPRPSPTEMRSANSPRYNVDGCTDASGSKARSKSNNTAIAFDDDSTEHHGKRHDHDHDHDHDDDDDDVSALTDIS
uniref:Uncharacterized protein n=1 Tax=Craspedostauros australis TaxID=1486917 RepID=A0A7S0F514_9STRA